MSSNTQHVCTADPSNEHPTNPFEQDLISSRDPSRLLPELYETIVDLLEYDYLSLKGCALVCHLFARRSQKHLFRVVKLGRPLKSPTDNAISTGRPSQRFYEVISHSQHLSKFVEWLEIGDEREHRNEQSWIGEDADLVRILPKLNNLKFLSITGYSTDKKLDLREWTPELKLAIMHKCPSLSRIYLCCIRNIPWAILAASTSLENLDLSYVSFVSDDATIPTVAPESIVPARLKRLSVTVWSDEERRSVHSLVQAENSHLDFSHLAELSWHVDVSWVFEDFQAIPNYLHTTSLLSSGCSKTLKDLHISFPDEVSSPSFFSQEYLDLGSMRSLRFLGLNGCIWGNREFTETHNPVKWLSDILAKLSDPSPLEKLSLLLTIEDFDNMPESGLENAGWEGFVTAVERATQPIDAFVLISISGKKSGSYVESVLERYLSQLLKNGVVVIGRVESKW